MLADLAAALPVDTVILGLHGAMIVDGYEDAEIDALWPGYALGSDPASSSPRSSIRIII